MNTLKMTLCILINKSLKEGVFPDKLKIAKVRPLFKAGDEQNPDNYRPISLLPVISKILEKFVYVKLVSHLEKHNVLYYRQFGFRKHHSTVDAFATLVGETLKNFSENNYCLTVFIDIRKAFDTVQHSIILSKLEKLGVRDAELNWFTSY